MPDAPPGRSLAQVRAAGGLRELLEGQPQHLLILFFMLCGVAWLLRNAPDSGRFLGLGSLGWAWLSVWLAVAHQLIVAAVFRLQLHSAPLTRLFGDRDLFAWGCLFFPFLLARPLTILTTGILDAGSLALWRPGELLLGAAFLAVAGWTMHSVVMHFTFPRALGGDHFRDACLSLPMVREGAFRWSGNAMYAFAFLGLWGLALLCGSREALVVAGFQHAYIWVHMQFTEAPDLRRLFGS